MKIKVDKRGTSDLKRLFRKSGLSVRELNGEIVTQAKANPGNQRTPDQEAARGMMKAAAQGWKSLPESARAKWNDYARGHGAAIADQRYKDLSGWDVYLPAWRNRSILGEEAVETPQDSAPPAAVTAVEDLFTGDEKTFSFRVTCDVPSEGHVLIVRVTPAAPTLARKPYPSKARMIRGHGKESTAPVPPGGGGGVVTFTDAQFGVEPGKRFGVAVRVVRVADGVHSRDFFADLIRSEA